MDNKQKHIFKQILITNDIPQDNVFVQHRNLKEFKSFFVERINPNHRIELYGRLKRSKVKDRHFNKAIKVGEILLCLGFFIFVDAWIINAAVNILVGIILFDIVLGLITENVNSDSGQYWKWKNTLSSPLP